MTKRVTRVWYNSNMKNTTDQTGKKNFPNNSILFPIYSNFKRILYRETQQQQTTIFLGVQTMNNSFDQIQSDSTSFENREAYEAQQEIETCRRCGQNEIDAWNVFDLCLDCFEACGE